MTWLATLGLLPRTAQVSGEAMLAGKNLIGAPEEELARVRGGRIGLIFQDPISVLNPVHRVGAQLEEACACIADSTGQLPRPPRRGGCSSLSAFPTRRVGSISIRTNCPEGRTSAS